MRSDIYTIRASLSNVYLIVSDAGCCLVDAGSPGEDRKILHQLHELTSSTLRLIYITHAHFDHCGSAAAIRRQTGAPIAIHHADAEDMARGRTVLGTARGRGKVLRMLFALARPLIKLEPAPADILLDDDDDLTGYGLDATVIHTPGHTAGSSALFLNATTLFAGDLLSSTGRPHLQRYFAQDWPSLTESLARVQSLAPDLVYPGHGRQPISGAALQKLMS